MRLLWQEVSCSPWPCDKKVTVEVNQRTSLSIKADTVLDHAHLWQVPVNHCLLTDCNSSSRFSQGADAHVSAAYCRNADWFLFPHIGMAELPLYTSPLPARQLHPSLRGHSEPHSTGVVCCTMRCLESDAEVNVLTSSLSHTVRKVSALPEATIKMYSFPGRIQML